MTARVPTNGTQPPPRIVVFDLGGVVVRICRTWAEGCAAAGVAHRPAAEAHFATKPVQRLLDMHQRGQLACADFHSQLSGAMNGIYAPDELARIHAAWTQNEYAGIEQVIDRIHAAGLDTACLSNTNASHWKVLHSGAAVSKIRRRHASHLMGLAKPSAEIYRAFEKATGAAPAEILFFDDLADNIAAARACAWNAVQVDHTGDTAAQVVAALGKYGVRL